MCVIFLNKSADGVNGVTALHVAERAKRVDTDDWFLVIGVLLLIDIGGSGHIGGCQASRLKTSQE